MNWRLTLLILWLPLMAVAQQPPPWEEAVYGLLAADDEAEAAQWEETVELLADLSRHPFNINTATRQQLEQLVFLTSQQVEQLQAYLHHYGSMKSLAELRLIPALDPERLALLPYFIYAREEPEQRDTLPRPGRMARQGRHELVATARVPFYERRGDQNGYLGYPYRHWLRYDFSYGQKLRLGGVGSQDAGEPFLSNRNRMGYDFYAYYLQVLRWGRLEQLVVGHYKLQAGLGLVVNNSFSPGKTALLSTLGRQPQTVRPHASRSESNHFLGAATTWRVARRLRLTLFGACQPLDATLNNDGQTVATLTGSGYHRTPTEMNKKHNTTATSGGTHVTLTAGSLHVGATALYTRLNRELRPNTNALYRRHYAQGNSFLNASIDYGFTTPVVALSGETAINRDGRLATINTVSLQLSPELSVMALQRFYSYRYTALFARSFGEGTAVQNESGIYAGCTWQPVRRLRVQAYTDYAYFAWARNQASLSSKAWDNQLSLSYSPRQWNLGARYRLHLRQRDNADKTALQDHWEQRARLSIGHESKGGWSLTTQGDLAISDGQVGYAVSLRAGFRQPSWQAQLGGSWFRADDYDTRLYTYERSMTYSPTLPVLYGRGLRAFLFAQATLVRRLTATVKLTMTRYTDRNTIGTGLQQIDSNTQTDLDMQLRWRF